MAEEKATSQDRALGVQLYNDTWTYLDKAELDPEEAEAMIHCCHASFHHWSRFEGKTQENLAIGYWQLARVYEKAGFAEACSRYANRCRAIAETLPGKPGLMVGALEVLARAAALRGAREERDFQLGLARELLRLVEDPEDRKVYEKDLAGVP